MSEGLRREQPSASPAVMRWNAVQHRDAPRLTVWCHTVKFNRSFITFFICPQGKTGGKFVRDIKRRKKDDDCDIEHKVKRVGKKN